MSDTTHDTDANTRDSTESTDTAGDSSDPGSVDGSRVVQCDEDVVFNRRSVLKLAAVTTGVVSGAGGYVSIASEPVRAEATACAVGDDISPDSVQKLPPNTLEYIRFDGDTEFTISWSDLNRGEVIDLVMQVRLDSVVDGDGNPVYNDLNDGFDEIGRMGVRVDEETATRTVTGKEFFEKRDYIAVTEKSDIDVEQVDVRPESEDDVKRVSEFTLRVTPDAPGFSSGDCMEWKMTLEITADLGFGYYFGELFGVVT